jgi:hypothetical protein
MTFVRVWLRRFIGYLLVERESQRDFRGSNRTRCLTSQCSAEPVSAPQFPDNRKKYREFRQRAFIVRGSGEKLSRLRSARAAAVRNE